MTYVYIYKSRDRSVESGEAGSSPQCSSGFVSQSAFSADSLTVHTAPVCRRMHQHLCVHYKSQAVAAIPLLGHFKILHTPTGMGSAALVAAVPCPAKATWGNEAPTFFFKKKIKVFANLCWLLDEQTVVSFLFFWVEKIKSLHIEASLCMQSGFPLSVLDVQWEFLTCSF